MPPSNETTSNSMPLTRGSYSLASLMTLVSFCAVLMAGAQPVARGAHFGSVALFAGVGALIGSVLGTFLGLYHFQRRRGAFAGFRAGGLVGCATGPVLLLDPTFFGGLWLVYSLGGTILIGLTWFISRPTSRRDA